MKTRFSSWEEGLISSRHPPLPPLTFSFLSQHPQPKLTEPLLKKPPFRFLHDIVTEVRKATGFPAELTDADLDSNNFKDKDSKVCNTTPLDNSFRSHIASSPRRLRRCELFIAACDCDARTTFIFSHVIELRRLPTSQRSSGWSQMSLAPSMSNPRRLLLGWSPRTPTCGCRALQRPVRGAEQQLPPQHQRPLLRLQRRRRHPLLPPWRPPDRSGRSPSRAATKLLLHRKRDRARPAESAPRRR